MKRTWTDPRDGKEWEVSAVARLAAAGREPITWLSFTRPGEPEHITLAKGRVDLAAAGAAELQESLDAARG